MEKFAISDFCFIRTPAYPINLLTKLHDESVPASDTLKAFFSEPLVQTALHSSTSTEFFIECQKWINGKKSDKENERIEETLIKYLVRMTTRSIPFALFSGFFIAEMAEKTEIEINLAKNVSHLRLDMEYIQDIIYKFKLNENIHNSVLFYTNSSIYRANDKFKYIEYTTDTYVRKYNYATVDFDEYLELVLDKAEFGAKIAQLVNAITDFDDEITEEEAYDYINQLVSSQLLVSQLESNVTGKDNLENLLFLLETHDEKSPYISNLKRIKQLLSTKKYDIENANEIKRLTEDVTGEKDHWSILQTDLEIGTMESKINSKVITEVVKQLQNLSPFALGIDRPDLKNFKERFAAKYDQQEVPMMEALDPEMGIGYGDLGANNTNDLIKDILFPPNKQGDPLPLKQDLLAELVVEKYLDFVTNKRNKIIIEDHDLEKLKSNQTDKSLPDSFFIHGSLLGQSAEAIDEGDFQFHLRHISGPPACLTIGRFCYTSEALTEKVKTFSKKEEELHPDALYAEIVHLTDSRVGNVTIRPHFREYEIQYLGKSDLDPEKLIPVSDILVSVKNNRIKLVSKRLGKEIIPRLTNAHVFTGSRLPIYKFLGEVQRDQGGDWLNWHWHHLATQKFLPRVEYKNILLKPARWLVSKEDLEFEKTGNNTTDYNTAVVGLAKRLALPRFVSFSEEIDKEFVVDLNSQVSAQFVINKINKNGSILLEEYLQSEDACWINDANGNRFTNSIMIPVTKVRESDFVASVGLKKKSSSNPLERKFFLGSSWTYYKLYTGRQTAEDFLDEDLLLKIEKLVKEKKIRSWHFLRYGDPDFHLRIRFNLAKNGFHPIGAVGEINEIFSKIGLGKGVQKLQIDTYEREIERYGTFTMEDSEKVFYLDSHACLKFIALSKTYDEEPEDRWLWCLRAIHKFFDSFDYNIEQRFNLLKNLEAHFTKVNNAEKPTLKQINAKYKKYELGIRKLLAERLIGNTNSSILRKGERILAARAKPLKTVALEIRKKAELHNEVLLDDLVGSYIHLFINRLFANSPNRSELLIYIFLNKHYLSRLKQIPDLII